MSEVANPWANHIDAVLDRLRDRGNHAQAEIIRNAARQGGYLSRADALAIIGQTDNETLRKFTSPVVTVCQEFRDRGDVPSWAPDLLEAAYYADQVQYQRAGGPPHPLTAFRVPWAAVELLNERERLAAR
jgi:hypothetical protein